MSKAERNRNAGSGCWTTLGQIAAMLAVAGVTTAIPAQEIAPAKAPATATLATAPAHLPYSFRNVAIVAGGFISGIVPHPTAKGLMYLRTDIGGAYRWESASNRWIPLTDWVKMTESNLLDIESIGLDPQDPDKLYLAAGTYNKPWAPNGAVLRSGDRGRTFDIVPMPFKMGGNEDGRFAGERLAVDPNLGSTLYLGSRDAGLWKSTDSGKTWAQVAAFPGKSTNHIGVVFEVFDAASGQPNAETPVVYVGVSATDSSLFMSKDAGATWQPVPGAPAGPLPNHGQLASDGWMYLTYGDQPGPNGMKSGAVWKFKTKTGKWKNITPEVPGAGNAPSFGYGGLAIDVEHPGTLLVSTMDHWTGGDTIYRSTDGGGHWSSLKDHSERDDSLSPYLASEDGKIGLGHWIGAIAIDPFDGNRALYGTGATVWGTADLEQMDAKKTTHWSVGGAGGVPGIEETAVVSFLSPPSGAHLFSGLGDIGCFRNDDFAISPRGGALKHPEFSNCESMDYAAKDPSFIVRVGRAWGSGAHGGYSTDGGSTWKPFGNEPPHGDAGGKIALSADGAVMIWVTREGVLGASTDKGSAWKVTDQAPARAQVVADKVNPERFYLYDPENAKLFVSNGTEVNFKAVPLDVPKWGKLFALPDRPDDLWIASNSGLFHADATANPPLSKIAGIDEAYAIGFGKSERDGYATLYLSAKVAGQGGIFRSTDAGKTWVEIDDDQHHYGWIGVLAGDPRVFGRVYLGTNGRGVITGDPAP